MQKNVGRIDQYIRLMVGFYMISLGIMKKNKMAALFGSMKVAEGITRMCPLLYLLGLTTEDRKIMEKIKRFSFNTK